MPGVSNSILHCGGYRTVGKMACFIDAEIMHLSHDDDVDDITNSLFSSLPSSQSSTDGIDSESELPDNEHTVDLIKYLDSDSTEIDIDFSNKCEGDCNSTDVATPNNYKRFRVSPRQDPFMGLGQFNCVDSTGSRSSTSSNSPVLNNLDFDTDHFNQVMQQPRFSAWNHSPKIEDGLEIVKSSTTSLLWITEDEQDDHIFPDTPSPSSRSGTATGDDSDVDIETVSDTPRGADSCGYVTQDSSPALSPAASPAPFIITAAERLSAETAHSGSSSGFTAYGVSSSASLAENLMAGRTSLHGQKRKLTKDKKSGSKSPTHVYTHILCNSNSVNFHDYAMSPGACSGPSSSSCTETGRPTVLTKRIYKRKQISVDASEKEKQHHHNQLERNRRQKLADLFVDLRDEVPKIANQVKASKVMILNESTSYIRELQKCERQQEDDISREMHKMETLKKQLRHLQSQISRNSLK